MLHYNLPRNLPSADELLDSDETPVDNELQELIPGLLKAILLILWSERMDWFFGIDMGIYYHPERPPIVPDAFLSLGVERFYDEELRPSYVLWDENVLPLLVLEVVSPNYRKEYSTKLEEYQALGEHVGLLIQRSGDEYFVRCEVPGAKDKTFDYEFKWDEISLIKR